MFDAARAAPRREHINWWRAATIACLLVIAVATATGVSMFEQFKAQIHHLQTQLQKTAQIRYLAVLLDDSRAPAMLITLDTQEGALQIQRLNTLTEGRADIMQLWALPANGQPRSLGVLASASKTLWLPASEKALEGVGELAISVEDKGATTQRSEPSLPYLFKGAVVQRAL